MASSGLWFRQAMRQLGGQPPSVRALAASVAVLLVAGIVSLGGVALSSSDDEPDATDVASGEPLPGDAGTTGVTPGEQPVVPGVTVPGGAAAGGSRTAVRTGGSGGAVGGGGATAGVTGGATGSSVPGGGGSVTTVAGAVPRTLTASDRGVTAKSVKVVFPWFDIGQYTSVSGTKTDEPLEGGPEAIRAYVDYINATGGIDGRVLEAKIEEFNPLNETDMRAKCLKWAEDDKAFAVVDSQSWHSDHQLCLTQDHDTPLVTNLGLTSEWTKRGEPYLWWTAPTTEETVADWIIWAKEAGRLTRQNVIGVVTGVKEEEKFGQRAIRDALEKMGLLDRAVFEEIPGYTTDIALANAALPGAVARMKGQGVDRLLMGLSSLAFTSWINHADSQEFFPKYLLSDFNNTITVAEALLARDHPKSLKGAIGPSYIRLGEQDVDASKFSPAEKQCDQLWRKANPKAGKIQRAGLAMRWCDNILLFAEGARRASRANNGVLTRKNWAAAMATIQGFETGMSPVQVFGPTDRSGPSMTKIVEIRTENEAYCKSLGDTDAHCHVTVSDYRQMRRF